MASKKELQVTQKRELEKKEETTIPARIFVPNADIYETKDGLNVVLEMPGVDKSSVDVRVEDDVLKVDGKLDFSKYRAYSRCTPSTMSVTFREASGFSARSIRARSQPSSRTAYCRSCCRWQRKPSREPFRSTEGALPRVGRGKVHYAGAHSALANAFRRNDHECKGGTICD